MYPCLAAIGAILACAQLGRAQDGSPAGTAGPGWLTVKDEALRERFHRLLLAVPSRDPPAAWQLAVDLGRPAAPLLWELLGGENPAVANRLLLLSTAVLAGSPHDDERLFAWLDRQKPMLEERTLAAMMIALGPTRTRPMPGFWPRLLGPSKGPENLLLVAARLAAVRFPGTAEGAPVLVAGDQPEPGLAAATAFAGLAVPPSVAQRLWAANEPVRHAELFWRGALLGAARRAGEQGVPEPLLGRARELMQLQGDAHAPVRAAAAWLRAVAGDLRADGGRPTELGLLRVAAADLATARRLSAWWSATAQPRDREPQRLAVAYALAHPVRDVVAARDAWGADDRIRAEVALALAFRLAGSTDAEPVAVAMPDLPEWSFVRAASGAPVERGARCADPRLQAALELLAADRLGRAALRDVLEETLWRRGSHPRCTPWELERALVRDLLLAGSQFGGNKYQVNVPAHQRYMPSGLDRNDGFFDVAVPVYEFLVRPRAPMPAEARLQ